ncbi:MAG: cadherin-like domain-containing protein, partial [Leisingera sp.]
NRGFPEIAVIDEDRFVISWMSHDAEGGSNMEFRGKVYTFGGTAIEKAFATEDQAQEIDVAALLENDTLAGADELIFALANSTSEYGASLSYDAESGTVFYDPTTAAGIQALSDGEALEDTFTYSVSDGNGGLSEATVTIAVGGLDEPGAGLAPEESGLLL